MDEQPPTVRRCAKCGEAAMLSAWQAKVGLLERAAALPPNS